MGSAAMTANSSGESHRRIRTIGADGLLIECTDAREAAVLAAWIAVEVSAGRLPAPIDLVPAAATLLVVAVPGGAAAMRAAIARVPSSTALAALPVTDGAVVTIQVRYDGPDLAETAAALEISTERLVHDHAAATWTVDFIGFAPGFGYCSAGDWPHRVSRLDTPRERVPAGSVAVADGWSAIYPRESPGGWRLIGTTTAVLWDAARTPPALLAAGTRVRFVATQ